MLRYEFRRAPAPTAQDLQRLDDNYEWFKLNAAIERGDVPLFFRAAMECLERNGSMPADMAEVIRTNSGGNFEYEAHSEVGPAFVRLRFRPTCG